MENSTKALLIAAGVLIVIVLIALGLSILNSGEDTKAQVASTSESLSLQAESAKDSATSGLNMLSMNEKEKFNYQFEQYFGDNVSGSRVKQLIDKIVQNNKQTGHKVYIIIKKGSTYNSSLHGKNYKEDNVAAFKEAINDNSRYKVRITTECTLPNQSGGYTSDGFIRCIHIEKN